MPATKIIKIDGESSNKKNINTAVEVLNAGGLVAFPTETVYGLGADAMNLEAIRKVFIAKGRPNDNPLIVHIGSFEEVQSYAKEIPEKGLRLAKIFWPGPLTLIMKKKENVPEIVTAGLNTVALRMPNHLVTLELLKEFNGGIVGPSANISGRPSPTSADHVFNDLNGKIDLIIDAGPTIIGVESTVLDVTMDPPVILRKGGLSLETIEKSIGKVVQTNNYELQSRSPGTRYRHYSPKARLIIIPKGDQEIFLRLIGESKSRNEIIGTVTYSNELNNIEKSQLHINIGSSLEQIARNLFKALRQLDNENVDVILVEGVKEEGIGAAVMDRLRKAAV